MLHVSLQRERLAAVFAELRLLFEDIAFPNEPLSFLLRDGENLAIVVGRHAHIWIDAASGMFVFVDDEPSGTSTFATPSAERLLDIVLSCLTRREGSQTPDRNLALIEKCVGGRIADVERALILATLRHCRGNRPRSADMLGISLQTLRSKLRACWKELMPELTGRQGNDREPGEQRRATVTSGGWI